MSQPLLDGYVEPTRAPEAEQRLESLEARVANLEAERERIMRDSVVAMLNLLGQSLRHVASGKIDLSELETPSGGGKWDAIKKRLPPRQAQVIDLLLAQGSMKRTQIAAAMRMDYSNCMKNVVGLLTKQGLLVESGGQLSLKEL